MPGERNADNRRNKLVAFYGMYPDCRAALLHWHGVASAADWKSPLDATATFSKAKALNDERVRFDIAGGEFRLIVAFDFRRSIAFIKFIGTHADYDKIDALTVSLFR